MHPTPPRLEFYRAADGERLVVRVWNAHDPPRARVVFLHGITSHGGWYERSCDYLARAGYEVHFLDRRGSGLNHRQRGDVDAWTTWISDVAGYLEQLGRSSPVVLCGISWGGKLAAAVTRKHGHLVRAVGLLCPGLYSPHEPGLLKRLVLAATASDRMLRRRVAIPLYAELFTDAPSRREFIGHDPLALGEVTFRFAREDRRLSRFARQSATFLRSPTLLMLAGRDRIVDNRRTRDFFARTAAAQKTLLEYTDAAHTLEFESEPSGYFADLANWIERVAVQ